MSSSSVTLLPVVVDDAAAVVVAEQVTNDAYPSQWRFSVQNTGPDPLYVGMSESVTESTGIRVDVNQVYEIPFGASLDPDEKVWARCAPGETASTRALRFDS